VGLRLPPRPSESSPPTGDAAAGSDCGWTMTTQTGAATLMTTTQSGSSRDP
jgi:hypothetical protein